MISQACGVLKMISNFGHATVVESPSVPFHDSVSLPRSYHDSVNLSRSENDTNSGQASVIEYCSVLYNT